VVQTAVEQQVAPQPGVKRFAERLRASGLILARLESDGRCQATLDVPRPIEALLNSALLQGVLLRERQMLRRVEPGGRVEVLPGLWLGFVDTPVNRSPLAVVPGAGRLRRLVVLLISRPFLDSEHFLGMCGSAGLDHRAAKSLVPPDCCVTPAEQPRATALAAWLWEQHVEARHRDGELQSLTLELAESYEELSLLYKFSTATSLSEDPRTLLTQACEELQAVVGLRWLSLQVSGDDRLRDVKGLHLSEGKPPLEPAKLRRAGLDLMALADERDEAWVIDDTSRASIPGLSDLGPDLLLAPLRDGDQTVGLIFGGRKLDGDGLSSVDAKLCGTVAGTLAIFLKNLMLFEDLQGMFLGAMTAVTSALDAKDSYTFGHSERVALIARQLAEATGMATERAERVHLAGLVHDVGKIGVPESVLRKPGKLTDAEYEAVKRHPEIGARILQDIRQMRDLLPGVLHHHERWDGRGYPHKLAGEDIPLMGRILGLADAFDAMSSNRTYRAAMPHREVLAEVRRCAGTQFDPDLTDVFVGLDFEPFTRLLAEHQEAAEMGGQADLRQPEDQRPRGAA
jgi:HD-GYP domain-containing protein (c-di-GMP phosphodiesterase class II)